MCNKYETNRVKIIFVLMIENCKIIDSNTFETLVILIINILSFGCRILHEL